MSDNRNGDSWGRDISDEEAARLEQANLQLQIRHRQEQLKQAITHAQAAELLGASPTTVARWITQGRLVALDDNPGSRLPVWQFTSDTKHPVLPDVDKLLAAFPGGPVALSRWMVRPNDNFHGRTPAQQMTRDSALVLAIVATLAAT